MSKIKSVSKILDNPSTLFSKKDMIKDIVQNGVKQNIVFKGFETEQVWAQILHFTEG